MTELDSLKYDAKRIKKAKNITISKALDEVAASKGYRNWSLLHKDLLKNEDAAKQK